MIQFLIALAIVAFALFIIYASERIIFHRRPAAAANHTLWAAIISDATFVVLSTVLELVLLPARRLLAKRNARLSANQERRRLRQTLQGKPHA